MADLIYRFRDDDFSFEEKAMTDGFSQYALEVIDMERGVAGGLCYDGEAFVGGVSGNILSQTLSIKIMWVKKEYRKKQIGSKAIKCLEDGARKKGCTVAFVDTMEYMAAEFYKKMGYTEIARIPDFVGKDARVFFRKELV